MNLTSLPWSVRREVIDLVIETDPEYCSVSREWMQQVAIRQGKLYIIDRELNNWPITPFTPYIEHVNFQRSNDINWDNLQLYDNLKHINICLYYQDVEDYTEFTSRLEGLPPLSSITLQLPENRDMDLSKVLEKSKDHIMELKLDMNSIACYPLNLVFSKLKCLHLVNTNSRFPVQAITRNAPNLNQLCLNCNIDFSDEVMPNILELDVTCQDYKSNDTLELSLLPKLKHLTISELLITSREFQYNQIESLTIKGTADQIMQISNITFTNLKILDLYNIELNNFQGMVNLFQHLTTLTTLTKFYLNIREETEFPINLPVGPYSFTDLTLRGPFLITPPSLTWLSQIFNLIHLKLRFCILKDDVNLPIVPFDKLNSLEIISSGFYFHNFEGHFNEVHYPHVKTIKLRKFNYFD